MQFYSDIGEMLRNVEAIKNLIKVKFFPDCFVEQECNYLHARSKNSANIPEHSPSSF